MLGCITESAAMQHAMASAGCEGATPMILILCCSLPVLPVAILQAGGEGFGIGPT